MLLNGSDAVVLAAVQRYTQLLQPLVVRGPNSLITSLNITVADPSGMMLSHATNYSYSVTLSDRGDSVELEAQSQW